MRFGLVELSVDLHGLTARNSTEAVQQGIRRDAGRATAVRSALAEAVRRGCDLVLLPGWTLVASVPPAWLVEASAGRTVVFECLLPEDGGESRTAPRKGQHTTAPSEVPEWCSWRGFVVADRRVVVGPIPQHVAEAAGLWGGDALSPHGTTLVRALLQPGPAGRCWTVPGVGVATLLLCGEANLVAGGGRAPCRAWGAVEEAGLTAERLAEVRLVANPAHTASGPQALRDKRAWLSRGGLLLHTANTHTAGWLHEAGEGARPGRASWAAARAWAVGEDAGFAEECAGEGFALRVLVR